MYENDLWVTGKTKADISGYNHVYMIICVTALLSFILRMPYYFSHFKNKHAFLFLPNIPQATAKPAALNVTDSRSFYFIKLLAVIV